jgi:hypothetical protein
MARAVSANPSHQRGLSIYQDCLNALLHPSVATYRMLGQQGASVWHAHLLVFASAVIGGGIDSLKPLESQLVAQNSFDALLLALIPVSALIAVCSVAAFAWCAQNVARLFKGSGSYRQLTYVLAAISAPLLIISSILDQIPIARAALAIIYLYWLAQYVVAIRAINDLSRVKAIVTMLAALTTLGLIWLGIAFLAGASGILLP